MYNANFCLTVVGFYVNINVYSFNGHSLINGDLKVFFFLSLLFARIVKVLQISIVFSSSFHSLNLILGVSVAHTKQHY